MALNAEERAFLKQMYQALDLNKPLPPTSPYYQPLYELEGCDDPVELLQRIIEFSEGESIQFFSGFRGSGKSTELLRLKQCLEPEGYIVFYSDVLDYINPAQPIDITDLLIVIAGAFSDAAEKFDDSITLKNESYWGRLWHYLNTTAVNVDEMKLTAIKDVVEFKLALKDVPTFRQKLQETMAARLFEFEWQVRKFFEDYVKAIRASHPGKQIVFLVDQLEQIRGSLFNERDVIASVERIFSLHMERLNLPYVHVIYTVPPWLKFVQPATQVVILHSVRQWNRDAARSPHGPGDQCLLELVKKRFGEDGFLRFFGSEDRALRFVRLSGGNVRDLLRLIFESIRRAQSLPLTDEVMQTAEITVRSSFLPIAANDALWLNGISETHDSGLPDTTSESVSRFTRFLDTHLVLYLRNGEEWYDVHPLIREEVSELARPHASGV